MASLIIFARLFSAEDEPVEGLVVNVQLFNLSTGRWRALTEAQTDARGLLKAEVDLRQIGVDKIGPALRLVEEGQAPRVLSSGPMLSVQGRARDILADFGEIERLDDNSFPRIDAQGENRDTVAGLARKKGVPQGPIINRIDRNPDLGRVVARGDTGTLATATLSRADLDPKVTAEIETMHAINLDNTAKLTEKDRIIATRDHELTLKTTELQTALGRATAAESKLAEVQTASRGEPADINSVFTNIGTKISSAHTTLKAQDNPYRIGTVKVDLKGALAEDGKIFLGGDTSDGSGVSVEMTPESERKTGDVQVKVPDVTGLTQSAARRILRSVGLRLIAASQTVAAGKAPNGQSLRQTPQAGRTAPHGSDVLVAFAIVSDT